MPPEEQTIEKDPDLELIVLQPGETVLGKVKRHPIGAFYIYLTGFIAVIAIAVLAVLVMPNLFNDDNRSRSLPIFLAVVLLLGVIAFMLSSLAEKVYWNNKWVLTSDSVTQILQLTLFNKQSSQLSLENVEDVTYSKSGILPTMFNYGKINIETAGNKSKFVLSFCDDPEVAAKLILTARENFFAEHDDKK